MSNRWVGVHRSKNCLPSRWHLKNLGYEQSVVSLLSNLKQHTILAELLYDFFSNTNPSSLVKITSNCYRQCPSESMVSTHEIRLLVRCVIHFLIKSIQASALALDVPLYFLDISNQNMINAKILNLKFLLTLVVELFVKSYQETAIIFRLIPNLVFISGKSKSKENSRQVLFLFLKTYFTLIAKSSNFSADVSKTFNSQSSEQ